MRNRRRLTAVLLAACLVLASGAKCEDRKGGGCTGGNCPDEEDREVFTILVVAREDDTIRVTVFGTGAAFRHIHRNGSYEVVEKGPTHERKNTFNPRENGTVTVNASISGGEHPDPQVACYIYRASKPQAVSMDLGTTRPGTCFAKWTNIGTG